jgi:hypothetical protein
MIKSPKSGWSRKKRRRKKREFLFGVWVSAKLPLIILGPSAVAREITELGNMRCVVSSSLLERNRRDLALKAQMIEDQRAASEANQAFIAAGREG